MKKTRQSDKEIIDAILNGENGAFNVIVEKYGNRMLNSIYSIVKDEEAAQDILQETFIKIYKNLDRFKGKSSLYTWMTRIAINNSLNYLKKAKKKQSKEVIASQSKDEEKEQASLENLLMKDEASPEKLMLKDEEQEMLRQVIDELPAIHKIVLRLRYFENFSIKEIAKSIGKPEGTIRSRLFYAREELKKNFLNVYRNN